MTSIEMGREERHRTGENIRITNLNRNRFSARTERKKLKPKKDLGLIRCGIRRLGKSIGAKESIEILCVRRGVVLASKAEKQKMRINHAPFEKEKEETVARTFAG